MGEPGLAPGLVQGVEGLAGGLVGLTRALLSGFERDLQGIGYCLGSGEAETSASRVPQPASAVKSPSAISNAAACLFKRNTSNVSAL